MLEALEVENFKAFPRQRFDLSALTLLSGLNGVGKSTVLQALALLRQSNEAGSLTSEGLLLNGDLVQLGIGQDVLAEDYVGDSASPRVSLELAVGDVSHRWEAGYERDADLLPLLRADQIPETALFGREFQYLRADRIVPAVSYPRSYEVAIRKGFLGSSGEHTANFLRAHADDAIASAKRRHEASESDRLGDQVEAWMQDFCPGVNINVDEIEGVDVVRLSYGFFGTAGLQASNRYRPTNVGFGLTYVLPVVVACLAVQPGGLLLTENPEAHLHPRGQSQMGRLLAATAASGAQVIVETHSDHVLNGLRLSVRRGDLSASELALKFLSRGADHRVTVDTPLVLPDGRLSDWPQGFFDEWDRALDGLLDD